MTELRDIRLVTPQEIQQLANNHAVAKNLRDIFPFPYTIENARCFQDLASKGAIGNVFAIYNGNVFVGVGSLVPKDDVYCINAEIGYWIGEPYWGKGYATIAVKLLVEYAFKQLNLLRVYAYIFSYNTASMRVLEKAGFENEAIIKSSIIKGGRIYDEHLYSIKKI